MANARRPTVSQREPLLFAAGLPGTNLFGHAEYGDRIAQSKHRSLAAASWCVTARVFPGGDRAVSKLFRDGAAVGRSREAFC
jgi:hypothetical protein